MTLRRRRRCELSLIAAVIALVQQDKRLFAALSAHTKLTLDYGLRKCPDISFIRDNGQHQEQQSYEQIILESGRQRVVKVAVKADWRKTLKACYERLRTWLAATAPQLEAAGECLRRLARQTTENPEEPLLQPASG